ncbi:MAG: hypothetical protein IT518_27955 [Burkholderiales bacterium]|nr:hypothetical protein [Burkholderiales bacterium]
MRSKFVTALFSLIVAVGAVLNSHAARAQTVSEPSQIDERLRGNARSPEWNRIREVLLPHADEASPAGD